MQASILLLYKTAVSAFSNICRICSGREREKWRGGAAIISHKPNEKEHEKERKSWRTSPSEPAGFNSPRCAKVRIFDTRLCPPGKLICGYSGAIKKEYELLFYAIAFARMLISDLWLFVYCACIPFHFNNFYVKAHKCNYFSLLAKPPWISRGSVYLPRDLWL